jgi:hypothetical protein
MTPEEPKTHAGSELQGPTLDVTQADFSLDAVEALEGSVLLDALREVDKQDDFFARHNSHSSHSRYPSGPGGHWLHRRILT